MLKKILLFSSLLSMPCVVHSFYNFLGGEAFVYEISYQGSIIIKSRFNAQTNNKASFTYNFSIAVNEETTKISQQVIDWQVSPILKGETLSFFPMLWKDFWQEVAKSTAYSIMLEDDTIITIAPSGKRTLIGTFLEAFLPVIDFKSRNKSKSWNYEYVDMFDRFKSVDMSVTGWDFFKQEVLEDNNPTLLFKGYDELITQISKNYLETLKNQKPTLFWLQNLNISSSVPFGIPKKNASLTGIYQIDLNKRTLEYSFVIAELSLIIPYVTQNSRVDYTVELNGIFILKEKKDKDI